MSKKSPQRSCSLRGSKDEMSLAIAFFQLSHLLAAGVGIEDSLEEVSFQEDSWRLRRIWRDLIQQVKDGRSLSYAMALWPGIFSSTIVAIVQSGEISGNMPSSLGECRQMLLWRAGVSSRINTVLIYPLMAFVVVVAVVLFLLVYLVPSVAGFIDDSVQEISWHTVVLLKISYWLQLHYQTALLVTGFIMVLAFMSYSVFPAVRKFADIRMLKSPYIGRLLLGMALSRYSENCARLYDRGVALDSAMQLSEGVVSNGALKRSLIDARLRVVSGATFSAAMGSVPLMPAVFVRMLKAGDSSGNLKHSLLQASVQQQQLTDTRIDRIEKLIGPALLIIVGIVLVWIVVSMLGPIYESAIDAVTKL